MGKTLVKVMRVDSSSTHKTDRWPPYRGQWDDYIYGGLGNPFRVTLLDAASSQSHYIVLTYPLLHKLLLNFLFFNFLKDISKNIFLNIPNTENSSGFRNVRDYCHEIHRSATAG
jgi:hypothetical protein